MPLLLATAAEMRELDRRTIEQAGLPGAVLMENAGAAAARAIEHRLVRPVAGANVAVLCGAGNNGGDGYVIARHLANRGARVTVHLVAPRAQIRGDARLHLEVLAHTSAAVNEELGSLEGADVVVDALLGTGLRDAPRGAVAQAIARITSARAPLTVAVDIPSGLHADTGHPLGACVRADLTVTMGVAKIGLVTAPGFEWAGELCVADLGMPHELVASAGFKAHLLQARDVAALLPPRPQSAHKGTSGHLLVVAGSPSKTGAALLCGEAALRAGAGLVTLAARPNALTLIAGRVPELMTTEVVDEAALEHAASEKRAVAIGPGIPTDEPARALVRTFARRFARPMVIDADALNALAGVADSLFDAAAPRVLTPHPAEAGRLLERGTEAVQADRVASARELARRTGAVVVLKGARSVIAAPDGRAFINPTGGPELATAGTGDVLTGVIGGLLAQGLGALDAACVGVYAHGRAGDKWARTHGTTRGMRASDVVAGIPLALTFAPEPGRETPA
jgi:NAD(P)H-hydrate epimerase